MIRPKLRTAWHPPYSRCRSSTWRASNTVEASKSVRKTARCAQCDAMRHVLRNTKKKCECEDVSSHTEFENTEQQYQRVFSRDDCHQHSRVFLGLTNRLVTPLCTPGKNGCNWRVGTGSPPPIFFQSSVQHQMVYICAISALFCCTHLAMFPIVFRCVHLSFKLCTF